jgi:DNA-binding protein Fis
MSGSTAYLRIEPNMCEPVNLTLEGRASVSLPQILEQIERTLVDWALKKCEGNQQKAADTLGIPRTTLRDKMSRRKNEGED